ncbi:hypothetical protein FHX80_115473 [Streptomyces brevispora]|uniref:Uncharacterized protein n=1 Tax=Streptomyces brevispora TaxID=887462 RepID=A0A561V5S7_9ACTN|nr:hypothetical protein FHX80_115473 [Streptomyces brevispora]
MELEGEVLTLAGSATEHRSASKDLLGLLGGPHEAHAPTTSHLSKGTRT